MQAEEVAPIPERQHRQEAIIEFKIQHWAQDKTIRDFVSLLQVSTAICYVGLDTARFPSTKSNYSFVILTLWGLFDFPGNVC